jgi:hypothetical protein
MPCQVIVGKGRVGVVHRLVQKRRTTAVENWHRASAAAWKTAAQLLRNA